MERFSLKIRNDIGLSRKYIAKMAGVSEATVMHYEKGDNVAMDSDTKLRKAYRTARNLYSKRNREAYMGYIRNYLDTNKIGIVEFSKMVQTGSDIYRDPKLKSRVLATADQIIKIEKATGIEYKGYIDYCDGIRKGPIDIPEEPWLASLDDACQEQAPLDISAELDKPVPTEEALQMAEQSGKESEEQSRKDVLTYIRNHATSMNGIETGLSYHISVNTDGTVSYYREWDEITVEHHKKELTAGEFHKATKYIEYEGGKR